MSTEIVPMERFIVYSNSPENTATYLQQMTAIDQASADQSRRKDRYAEQAPNSVTARRDQLDPIFRQIANGAGVAFAANRAIAKDMSLLAWKRAVQTKGMWDFKNNPELKKKFSSSDLDKFGNFHFGIVARAQGFRLVQSIYLAGTYQVGSQGGGNMLDWSLSTDLLEVTAGGVILPDSLVRSMTNQGFTWGDNPGDSINIMKGYDYEGN